MSAYVAISEWPKPGRVYVFMHYAKKLEFVVAGERAFPQAAEGEAESDAVERVLSVQVGHTMRSCCPLKRRFAHVRVVGMSIGRAGAPGGVGASPRTRVQCEGDPLDEGRTTCDSRSHPITFGWLVC